MEAALNALSGVSNDAKAQIEATQPYSVEVAIEGVVPLLFHRWSCEDVAEKANARKGSKTKKQDNVEAYVYRTEEGEIGIPGVYLTASITNPKNGAAKYLQDPRSPRKSALDLYRAGVVSNTELASLGKREWDFIDKRRVTIQGSGITRCRPAMAKGWKAIFELSVLLPEYIRPSELLDVLVNAGRFVGIADMRPTYGRFQVTNFNLVS